MNNSLRGRDYINIHDLSSEDFRYLIDLAWNLKAQKKSGVDQRYFPGKNVLANFEWGSTRTRCAFETSCNDLGMGFTYLTNSHMGDCETVKDAMRVFNGMYDLIVYRAQKDEQFLYDVADLVDIPVINALTLGDHPTQMLADALTMEEQWAVCVRAAARRWLSLATAPAPRCGMAVCALCSTWTSSPSAPTTSVIRCARK